MDIGGRIKKLRLEKEWNQGYLAEKLNCSVNAISQYETGKRKPDIETVNKLSKIFELPASYFIADTPEDAARLESALRNIDNGINRLEKIQEDHENEMEEIRTKQSYTVTLLKALIDNGAIKNPDDIKEKNLDLLIQMLEMDAEEFLKDK